MKIKFIIPITIWLLTNLLTSCNGFFEKDNTPPPAPLVQFTAKMKPRLLWSVKIGGVIPEYLRLTPTISESLIFTTDHKGILTAIHKVTGQKIWQVDLKTELTTGPGVGEQMVVVASQHGMVSAYQKATGKLLWNKQIASSILAKPVIQHSHVIIKTVNGQVHALATHDGSILWSFQQVEPALILYHSSSPLIVNNSVIVGFANGNLANLDLADGQLLWLQPLATPEGIFTVQRMIDIDADPIVFGNYLYAATYQGNLTALHITKGTTIWSRKISSYAGMAIDENHIYISDAKSNLWALNKENGQLAWQQTQLQYRVITPPALLDKYVVVGDAEGYLHWLEKKNGQPAARVSIGGSIYATPLVDQRILYILTNNGYLTAYTV